MARLTKRLDALDLDRFIKESSKKIRSLHDGEGLYFVVDGRRANQGEPGTASWTYRYMFERKARMLGLGPYPTIKLKDARKKAADARYLKANGQDPLAIKDATRKAKHAADARAVTFRVVAADYLRANKVKWKNAKHGDQWSATLNTYAYPIIGDLVVGDIDPEAVLRVLRQPIVDDGAKPRSLWEARPETASRLRGRIETVLDFAKVKRLRDGDNPAAWRGNLKLALPARSKVRKVKHHAALPVADLCTFMADLRDQEGTSPRALEFAILTVARTGEVLGAIGPEIDVSAKLWTIPAARMKGGREHRVPLSERALEIVRQQLAVTGGSGPVFPGATKGKPLSSMALLMLLRRMKRGDFTAHGFRSTFRDWVSEKTSYPPELAERALAHAVADKTERAYARADLMEKRRELMEAWADFAGTPRTQMGEA